MYNRIIAEKIEKRTSPQKAIILIGARQVGKTTLLKSIYRRSTKNK